MQAYLVAIVKAIIAEEFACKVMLILPPDSEPNCKPNLLSAFGIEVLNFPSLIYENLSSNAS